MLMLAILLAAQNADTLIANFNEATRVTPRCDAPSGTDVTVCGRRAADRYRAPLVEHDPGDPAHESVAAERQRLQARTNNCQEKSTFKVGCGMAGVSAGASFGPDGFGKAKVRTPAD